MKRTWMRWAVMTLALLVGCRKEAVPRPEANVIYDEFFKAFTRAFEIDAANGNFVVHHGGDAALGTLVFHSATRVPDTKPKDWDHRSWSALSSNLPSLRKETYEDFWLNNAEPQVLSLSKAASWRVYLLSNEEYKQIVTEGKSDPDIGFWGAFRTRFPDGQLTGISAPGISHYGTQVLIYLYSGFGPLAASASYYLMEKQEGIWKITDEWMLWVS